MRYLRLTIRQKLFLYITPWLLVGCSFNYDQGLKLEQEQRWAEAAIEYRIAAIDDPDNEEIREALTRMNIRVAAENFRNIQAIFKGKGISQSISQVRNRIIAES